MKPATRILNVSVLAAVLLLAANAANATPTPITSANPDFQDTATSSTRLNVGGGNSISGTFNIENDAGSLTIGSDFSDAGTVYNDETGFNPAAETVVSGTMNLWLKTTTGSIAEFSVNIDSPETGSINGPNNGEIQYDFGSGDLSGTAIASLNSDGELSWSITNGGKGDGYTDFTVEDIVLQVVTTDPVPDSSSTVLLLGAVLTGIGFLRRKLT
jgi:protein with PEP-CTERM/exosortase system signal